MRLLIDGAGLDPRYRSPVSNSLAAFMTSLVHADRLIEGTKIGRGRPTSKEASMFVASVALTYAAWEAYVEDVAIEVSEFLADNIDPSNVPASARSTIEAVTASAWELTVHPGWREIWKKRVAVLAKGDSNSNQFGMNTASVSQIERLYSAVGVSMLKNATRGDKEALAGLILARGKVVHTANTPESFNKQAAKDYRNLVERLAVASDATLGDQAHSLVGRNPW